jgi:hypothetical protein
VNEAALAHWGLSRQKKGQKQIYYKILNLARWPPIKYLKSKINYKCANLCRKDGELKSESYEVLGVKYCDVGRW